MGNIKNLDQAREWLLGVAELLGYHNEHEAAREVLEYPNSYSVHELAWAEEVVKEVGNEDVLSSET